MSKDESVRNFEDVPNVEKYFMYKIDIMGSNERINGSYYIIYYKNRNSMFIVEPSESEFTPSNEKDVVFEKYDIKGYLSIPYDRFVVEKKFHSMVILNKRDFFTNRILNNQN